jgi:hypothetical protein
MAEQRSTIEFTVDGQAIAALTAVSRCCGGAQGPPTSRSSRPRVPAACR